ncbi:MAG: hypothetical protein IPP40_00445 [bacterium]|nr:hypothetical protein [bacterium]
MLSVVHNLIAPQWLTAKRIVVFEDDATAGQLFPLNVLRPSWEIRAGLGSLREWLNTLRSAGYSVSLRPRVNLVGRACELSCFDDSWADTGEPVIFLNGRLLHLPKMSDDLPKSVVDKEGHILWALVSGRGVSELLSLPGTKLAESLVKHVNGGTQIEAIGGLAANYVWDYMSANERLLKLGFGDPSDELLGSTKLHSVSGVQMIGAQPVYAGVDAHIFPTVVLDTSDGPIWFGRNVTIEPHCYLKGPLALGDQGRVKAGAALYGGSAFGPQCRLNGEISSSIMQGYVNKQHAGFLGNSHLGEWVNLGADTTVSNLRNDYGNVKVKVNQKLVDTGKQFVGLLCGDHTKTGINTMFNTGTIVGVGANVYGGGYPPRFIRSFSWGGNDGFHVEPLARTIESAKLAVSRRGRELSQAEIELLTEHYSTIVKQEN